MKRGTNRFRRGCRRHTPRRRVERAVTASRPAAVDVAGVGVVGVAVVARLDPSPHDSIPAPRAAARRKAPVGVVSVTVVALLASRARHDRCDDPVATDDRRGLGGLAAPSEDQHACDSRRPVNRSRSARFSHICTLEHPWPHGHGRGGTLRDDTSEITMLRPARFARYRHWSAAATSSAADARGVPVS